MLTFKAYNSLGRIEGALAQRAEEEFQKLPAAAQTSFDPVMQAMVTNGSDDKQTPTKRWALLDELTCTEGARVFVEAFISARLFQTDQDNAGRPTVTVCHEALLIHWSRLEGWLRQNRENLVLRDRVRESAREWQENAQPGKWWSSIWDSSNAKENYLLRGKRLAEVKSLNASRPRFHG